MCLQTLTVHCSVETFSFVAEVARLQRLKSGDFSYESGHGHGFAWPCEEPDPIPWPPDFDRSSVRSKSRPKHAPFASFCRGTRRLRFPADPRCLDTDIQVICRTRPRAGLSTDRIVAGAWNDSGNRLSRDDAVEKCGRAKSFRSRWSGRFAPCVRRWPWADTATQSRGRGTQNRVARAPGERILTRRHSLRTWTKILKFNCGSSPVIKAARAIGWLLLLVLLLLMLPHCRSGRQASDATGHPAHPEQTRRRYDKDDTIMVIATFEVDPGRRSSVRLWRRSAYFHLILEAVGARPNLFRGR